MSKLFRNGYRNAVDFCLDRFKRGRSTVIFTPNAEMLSETIASKEISSLLGRADLLLPDGIGVYLASLLHGERAIERTNGIDFAERLLERASREQMSVFLLGAREGVAEKASDKLCRRFKGLRIVGGHHGYFDKFSEENCDVIEKINRSGADILLVCFGFPVQERWIADNISRLDSVKIAVGLGGSLDVWADNVRRAPRILRCVGLEWAFRMVSSPERIARLPKILRFLPTILLRGPSNILHPHDIVR